MTELSSSVPGAEPGEVVGAGELPGRGRPQPPRKSSAAKSDRAEARRRLAELAQRLEKLSAESDATDAEIEKLRVEIMELEVRSKSVRQKLGTSL